MKNSGEDMVLGKRKGIRTWVEVDKTALKNNYNQFRKIIDNKCKLLAISKSNAYGHGLIDYSREMEKLGCDFLGVDSITEALALRKDGIKIPILVLGYTLPEMIEEAAKNNISITISNLDQLKGIKKNISKTDYLNVHIKIDTGMHRQGFYLNQLKDVIKELKSLNNVKVEGIYTHFASAKNPAFPEETNKQIAQFKKACDVFQSNGYDKIIRHAAATGGAIIFPDAHFDMVRIGVGLFGIWPSLETKGCYCKKMFLKPALSWRTIVSEIKKVKKGESIGYDYTETFARDSKIAIIPIGYWHGFCRNLSSVSNVLIRGQEAKVMGRVSMDMIIVDVTDIENIEIGDVVTIIGKDQDKEISAQDFAKLSDTSWYEIITTINPLIKRIYV